MAFCGNVPHGGMENMIDHVYYYLHAYVDLGKLRDDQISNNEDTIPYNKLHHNPMQYDMMNKMEVYDSSYKCLHDCFAGAVFVIFWIMFVEFYM